MTFPSKEMGFIKPKQSCSVAEDDFQLLILLHPPLGAGVTERWLHVQVE